MIYAARVEESGKGRGEKGRVVFVISKIENAIKTRLETINASLGEKNALYDSSTLTPIPFKDVKSRMNSEQEKEALAEGIQRINRDFIPWFLNRNGHIPTARYRAEDDSTPVEAPEEGGDDGRCES